MKMFSTDLPVHFSLYQNYPNPFNPSTEITYSILKPTVVQLVVYDILGREITTLVDEKKQAGEYAVVWNAGDLPAGVYFCRLNSGSYTAVKKLLLLK